MSTKQQLVLMGLAGLFLFWSLRYVLVDRIAAVAKMTVSELKFWGKIFP